MSTSFTIAAANNRFAPLDIEEITLTSAKAYREAMREFAELRTLDVWYAHISEATINQVIEKFDDRKEAKPSKSKRGKKHRKGSGSADAADIAKAANVGPQDNVKKPVPGTACTHSRGYRARRRQAPHRQPTTHRDPASRARPHLRDRSRSGHGGSRGSVPCLRPDPQRRSPPAPAEIEVVDVARKVVGVGSVGTRAWIVLLEGRDSTIRCSFRSRKPPDPSSRTTCCRPAVRQPRGAGRPRAAADVSRL